MKELLKQFIPPVILDGLRKLRGDATGCIELSGWPDSGDDYNNTDIAQLVAAKTAYRISHAPEELTLSELQSIAAVAAAAAEMEERPLRVIDIGGGCGIHFFQLY